eukprot:scaffold385_cov182-Ochromonas_danica.AAC.7
MTYEENLTYYWEINNHQACATFADDLTFTELQAQLQKLQQAKEEREGRRGERRTVDERIGKGGGGQWTRGLGEELERSGSRL